MGSQPIRIQLGKILRENLVGNAVGNLVRNAAGNLAGNLVGNPAEKVLMVVTGLKMANNTKIGNCWHLLESFKPITTTKTLSNYFYLVEEVLNFDLVGHIRKSVNNWLQKCIFMGNPVGIFQNMQVICGKCCGKFCGKCCRKCFRKSCGKWLGE